ncbi:unnamed protein product, partial [Mesorhabditis belari]|uniref:DUF7027 domain-containing protein n=1 Tax=Mesorhabditis belari TaxID=2138241 RepID=A0AAF3J2V1_9BILA
MRRKGEGVATLMALLGPPPGSMKGSASPFRCQQSLFPKNIPTTVIRRPSSPGEHRVVERFSSTSSPPFNYAPSSQSTSRASSSTSICQKGASHCQGSPVCLTVSSPLQPGNSHTVRYTLPINSRKSSLGSCEKDRKTMDFDPHGAKWQCCCCNLPNGLKILAVGEVLLSSIIITSASAYIATSDTGVTWFLGSLIVVCIIMAVSSILLFAGIHRHSPQLLYPTLGARSLLIIFFTVFCGSVITAPNSEVEMVESATMSMDQKGHWTHHPRNNIEAASESLALRLVALVFGMLFFAVLVLYTIYLVLRCVGYERSFARLRERRESFIQAGMIDPDLGSRRGSNC